MKDTQPVRVRFGVFELDLKTGELRGGGQTVRLTEKPFRVLLILAEHGGELVTREEIQKRLWPNNTIVDFEHGINTAIKMLRRALGDSADEPKYIETIPRRGYRLLAPVEWVRIPGDESSSDGGAAVGKQSEVAILTGRTVSHYRVLDIIGGGGMGVVYRAEDLKLGRQVALKFLPEELGSDPHALERFSREARAASSLDHPNICPIHEFGEHEGRPFMVMQSLEGQTLRDRLEAADGALPIEELLDIGIQVSDGLQAAHERGIIHRDIKPANIFLTHKGICKILDFGLAKLAVEAPEAARVERAFRPASTNPVPLSSRAERVPQGGTSEVEGPAFAQSIENAGPSTARPPVPQKTRDGEERGRSAQDDKSIFGGKVTPAEATLTRTGVAMGTAGYMSPEQVRGEKLDARTDLFSFGLVLYEMATGQRAFTGETAAVVHDAILHNSPVPVRELNSTLPAKLLATIDKALEKDRERRYQSAAEMGTDLRVLQHSSTRPRGSRWILVGAAAVVLCVAGFFVLRPKPRPQQPAKEPTLRQLTPSSLDGPVINSIALSSDGKHLAYLDSAKGVSLLQTDTGENRSLPGTASFFPNSWLPDGDHLFVSKPGALGSWTMSILDGTVRKFRDEGPFVPSPNGQQLAFKNDKDEIWIMSATGESPKRVVAVKSPWTLRNFTWSPTGRRIAYDKFSIHAADRSKSATETDVSLDSCDLDGHCSTILSDSKLQLRWFGDCTDLFWLRDGRIIFSLTELPPNDLDSNLWSLAVDPNTGLPQGKPKRLTSWTGFSQRVFTASADGKRLVFQQVRIEDILKIAEIRARGGGLGPARPLNSETWLNGGASWTPDSKTVLFTARGYGKKQIFEQDVGARTPQPLVSGSSDYDSPVVSPDGKWLFYSEHGEDGISQLMRMPIEGGLAALVLPGDHSYRCASAPATLCVFSDVSGTRAVFYELDPLKGRGRELARADIKKGYHAWGLSPNGKNIALVAPAEDQVRMISTDGGDVRSVPLRGWNGLQFVSWTADGRRLYLSGARNFSELYSEFAIIEADLAGNIKMLVRMSGAKGWIHSPVASPDGRYLLYNERTFPSSVMMLENF